MKALRIGLFIIGCLFALAKAPLPHSMHVLTSESPPPIGHESPHLVVTPAPPPAVPVAPRQMAPQQKSLKQTGRKKTASKNATRTKAGHKSLGTKPIAQKKSTATRAPSRIKLKNSSRPQKGIASVPTKKQPHAPRRIKKKVIRIEF